MDMQFCQAANKVCGMYVPNEGCAIGSCVTAELENVNKEMKEEIPMKKCGFCCKVDIPSTEEYCQSCEKEVNEMFLEQELREEAAREAIERKRQETINNIKSLDGDDKITIGAYTLACDGLIGYTISNGDNHTTMTPRMGNMLDDFGEDMDDFYIRVWDTFNDVARTPWMNVGKVYIHETDIQEMLIHNMYVHYNGEWYYSQLVEEDIPNKPFIENISASKDEIYSCFVECNKSDKQLTDKQIHHLLEFGPENPDLGEDLPF